MARITRHPKEIENTARMLRAAKFLYLARFADTINRYIEISMRKDNVSRLRWAILSLLIVRGGRLTPTPLARMLLRSKHSMTSVVDTLEREGYIIRNRANKDRRVIQVQITPAGLDYVIQTIRKEDEWVEEIMSSLNKDEQELLVNLTKKLGLAMVEKINSLNSS